jgi:hypothetical protein
VQSVSWPEADEQPLVSVLSAPQGVYVALAFHKVFRIRRARHGARDVRDFLGGVVPVRQLRPKRVRPVRDIACQIVTAGHLPGRSAAVIGRALPEIGRAAHRVVAVDQACLAAARGRFRQPTFGVRQRSARPSSDRDRTLAVRERGCGRAVGLPQAADTYMTRALTTRRPGVYYKVTMLSRPCEPVCQSTTGEIARRILRILSDLLSRVVQVLDKNEAETEPEQFIEKAWLTESKKAKLSNLLKTKDRVSTSFFVEIEPEYLFESKRHEAKLIGSEPETTQ